MRACSKCRPRHCTHPLEYFNQIRCIKDIHPRLSSVIARKVMHMFAKEIVILNISKEATKRIPLCGHPVLEFACCKECARIEDFADNFDFLFHFKKTPKIKIEQTQLVSRYVQQINIKLMKHKTPQHNNERMLWEVNDYLFHLGRQKHLKGRV